jgi:hypothetical protein
MTYANSHSPDKPRHNESISVTTANKNKVKHDLVSDPPGREVFDFNRRLKGDQI